MSRAPFRRTDAGLILTLLLLPCVAFGAGTESTVEAAAPGTLSLIARAIGSLAGVVALIALLALLLRRLRDAGKSASASHALRSLERVDLGGRRELRVVRIGGRSLLLGVTESRIDLLTELEDGLADAADGSDQGDDGRSSASPALRVLRKLASSG